MPAGSCWADTWASYSGIIFGSAFCFLAPSLGGLITLLQAWRQGIESPLLARRAGPEEAGRAWEGTDRALSELRPPVGPGAGVSEAHTVKATLPGPALKTLPQGLTAACSVSGCFSGPRRTSRSGHSGACFPPGGLGKEGDRG